MSLEKAIDLLAELQAQGIRLRRVGDRILPRPEEGVSQGQLAVLAEQQEDLLALLDLVGEGYEVEAEPQPFLDSIEFGGRWSR